MESFARGIVARLQANGFTALFAGGCVRDRLMGRDPHDFDVATDAPPEAVQRLFPRTVAVGAHFGVVCVVGDGMQVEVAAFRDDGVYLDGRRPESVQFSTPERDAQRRDFTVNGLFLNPITGEVIDYVGGRKDLEARVLRAIGNPAERFREDRLRLLRAVRMATVLDFEIEPETWAAVKENARFIHEVSAERIRDELVKIFVHPRRLRGFDLLDQSGLMREILPEMEALKGCEQPPQFHPEGDVFVHTRKMVELLPQVELPASLVLSVLFHDIGKPGTYSYDPAEGRIRFSGHDTLGAQMTEELMTRLRFPRKEIDATVTAVECHMAFKDVQKMRVSRLKRFMARPGFDEEMELHRVDCTSSHGDLSNYTFLQEKADEFAHEPLIPPPLVSGKDLIALGLKPGPRFREILDAVESRQLEGAFNSREEALEWVRGFVGTGATA
jgi:poly(A) polymerase